MIKKPNKLQTSERTAPLILQEDANLIVVRGLLEKDAVQAIQSLPNGLERWVLSERPLLAKVDMGYLYRCNHCGARGMYRTWNNLNLWPITASRPHCEVCRNPLYLTEAKLARDLNVAFVDGFRCTNCKNAYPHTEGGQCPACLSAVEVLKRFYPMSKFWACRWCSNHHATTAPEMAPRTICNLCGGKWQPVASQREQIPQLWC